MTSNIITPAVTLASLASSATAGRQSGIVTVADAQNRVPMALDITFFARIAATAPTLDKSLYLYVARSNDEVNYEAGPGALGAVLGATDATFTFASSPVGTTPLPSDFLFLGVLQFNASNEARRKVFRLFAPPPKLIFVVLNYAGVALTATAGEHGIQVRKRWGEAGAG